MLIPIFPRSSVFTAHHQRRHSNYLSLIELHFKPNEKNLVEFKSNSFGSFLILRLDKMKMFEVCHWSLSGFCSCKPSQILVCLRELSLLKMTMENVTLFGRHIVRIWPVCMMHRSYASSKKCIKSYFLAY